MQRRMTMTRCCALWTTCFLLACGGGDGDGDIDAGASADAAATSVCGDNLVEGNEACDDGNTADGDGCSADCSTVSCLVPVTFGSIQEGIDDGTCPTLHVQPGRYVENLTIPRDVIIEGVGAADVIVDGAAAGSVVTVQTSTVTLRNLSLENGQAALGGGVYNAGDLTLENVVVRGNTATSVSQAYGGGIYNLGPLTVRDSQVVENTALSGDNGFAFGGGMYAEFSTVELYATEIADNRASALVSTAVAQGGGIAALGVTMALRDGCSVSGNRAEAGDDTGHARAEGGGLHVFGNGLTVEGSTIANNTAHAVGTLPMFDDRAATAEGGGIWISGGLLTLTDDSSITGNEARADSQVGAWVRGGGVLLSESSLHATQSAITENAALAHISGSEFLAFAQARAGAVGLTDVMDSRVDLTDSQLSNNRAEASSDNMFGTTWSLGGAMFVFLLGPPQSTAVTLTRSVAFGNAAISQHDAEAGLIYASAGEAAFTMDVIDSTLADNRAESLGTGDVEGGLMVARASTNSGSNVSRWINSTISGNRALTGGEGLGGAVYAETGAGNAAVIYHLANATVTDNEAADEGGAFWLSSSNATATTNVQARNSIISDNMAPTGPNCFSALLGHILSSGYNLIDDRGGCDLLGDTVDDINESAQLDALADNGGPTMTHAPMAGSRAIDAGNPAGCTDDLGALLTTDQRGQPRPENGRCDIGAYETAP